MKKRIIRIIVIVVSLACVLGVAYISSSKLLLPYRHYSFVKMPLVVKPFIAGELVDGRIVEQRLFLSKEDISATIPKECSFCVGALMATYCDRRNKGSVLFSVKCPDGSILLKEVSFHDMKDNKYHRVCFDYPFRRLHPGEYLVRLEGVGGKPGSSATVWLTKDIKPPFNSMARVNGEAAEGVMVTGFSARQQTPILKCPIIVLVSLYAALVAFLVYILFPKKIINGLDCEK
jgi:hypothetical protein